MSDGFRGVGWPRAADSTSQKVAHRIVDGFVDGNGAERPTLALGDKEQAALRLPQDDRNIRITLDTGNLRLAQGEAPIEDLEADRMSMHP